MLNQDSSSVTKDELKKFNQTFPTHERKKLSADQVNQAFVLIKSRHNFTSSEIKEQLESTAEARKKLVSKKKKKLLIGN